jgi:hypothetical protein
MPKQYDQKQTIQIIIYGRNLRTFDAMKLPIKYLRFLLFFGLFVIINKPAASQNLTKFQIERKGNDGLLYVFEGMLGSGGEIVIPANYDYIWDFQDSLTLARKRINIGTEDEGAFIYQIISQAGYLIYEFPLNLIPESISDGLILTYNKTLHLYGFINLKGDVTIKFMYSEAKAFSEGLAAVKSRKSDFWGYIDKLGITVLPYKFESAYSFSEGKAITKINNKYAYIRASGSFVNIEREYFNVFDLKEGKSIVTQLQNDTVLYGFIDSTGKEILKPQYEFIDNFEEGMAVFVENGEAGMLSESGTVVIPARYDEIYRFDQAHYLFQQNGLQGLVRIDGTQVLPARYSAIGLFHEGLCAVKQNGLWGFANTNGELIISCQYSEIDELFNEGKAVVRSPDKYYLVEGIDTLNLPKYDEVLPYYGYCAAFRIGNLWGFLNQNGEEAIEPKYDELVFNKGSVVFARSTSTDGSFVWSVIDPYGREVQSEMYNEVVRFSEGLAAVRKKDKWGFINSLGAEIVSPQYDFVRNYSSGKAAVSKDGQWGFIGKNGREEIPLYPNNFVFEEKVNATSVDSINHIRESFPLYLMQVLGDFTDNCVCVEDLTLDNAISSPICMNKIGKIVNVSDCQIFTKVAELFNPEAEQNTSLKVIRELGEWITIDKQGLVVE